MIKGKILVRDYALFCLGRFVAQAKGEHEAFTTLPMSIGTAEESAKSNALMRCCKDLGVASGLLRPFHFLCVFSYRIFPLRALGSAVFVGMEREVCCWSVC